MVRFGWLVCLLILSRPDQVLISCHPCANAGDWAYGGKVTDF